MQIFITGGTGFIGQALIAKLVAQGDSVTILTRQASPTLSPLIDPQAVKFCRDLADLPNLNGFDAVINLAGEPIFTKRWTAHQKVKLTNSRVQITQKLVELIANSQTPPRIFLSGSATGFYGDLPYFAKNADETTACGTNFTATLCQQWEKTALQAEAHSRVCLLRTGLVLSPDGGALQKMLPLYRLGLGGKLGNGTQHWAWIGLEDYLQAVIFLLKNANCRGTFNLVAPNSVSNADFNCLLARHLHRPAFCHAPRFALQWLLGERSQILLDNQPLVPQKLLENGFTFSTPTLTDFLLQNLK